MSYKYSHLKHGYSLGFEKHELKLLIKLNISPLNWAYYYNKNFK